MTPESVLLPYAVGAVSTLLGILVLVLGWTGSQINRRLENLTAAVAQVTAQLARIDKDLRDDMHGLDRRVTKIESMCLMTHAKAEEMLRDK